MRADLVVRQVHLWYWQRISAIALALFVTAHLATILYAVRGGLTAAEILARTRGSALAAAFYGLFVLACAIHAPIGLARIAEEWLGWSGRASNAAAAVLALALLFTGWRAVYALVMT
jgi:fumarate reductase subunit C